MRSSSLKSRAAEDPLEDAPGARSPADYVDHTSDAMLDQQLGDFEAVLDIGVGEITGLFS